MFGKERPSQMGTQETEGHSRTHPELSNLELRVAVHDAWELDQAVNKPSSLEEVPARLQCVCLAVFTFSPRPSKANASRALHQQAESSPAWPGQKEAIPDIPEKDSKASPGGSKIRRCVYSFSSLVKIPRLSASWNSEQYSAGVASVPWGPASSPFCCSPLLSGLAQQLLSAGVLDVSLAEQRMGWNGETRLRWDGGRVKGRQKSLFLVGGKLPGNGRELTCPSLG